MWQAALKGTTVVQNGEELTADELSQMYLDKVQELEDYKNSI